ncbi:MAG: deoxyribodipyrimidine photo-lyase [Candidatus Omnitrophica bacterium]|nr:deoxyribodipyrimidine photo-lyase [Candidatus Omnitrophota bacterium]
MINPKRIISFGSGKNVRGPVCYWMSRDQRMDDNWALLYAQEQAKKRETALVVLFCMVPDFLGATRRQYGFMLKGLQELEARLREKQIGFEVRCGSLPAKEVCAFVNAHRVSLLVTDFDPLRIKRQWKRRVIESGVVPVHEVDAHNIVPCRKASDKKEFAAYTIRPKINRRLEEFLEDFPAVKKHPFPWSRKPRNVDWEQVAGTITVDESVGEVDSFMPGENHAAKALKNFVERRLSRFRAQRNDPNAGAVSDLSPYLHFGQLSAQRAALTISAAKVGEDAKQAFLEELIVRRELSDNFCFYEEAYDSVQAFPEWAAKTLHAHAADRREYVYTREQFAQARTHDELWNAAQRQMLRTGKMHGYMRMYWAKKILEWTRSPQEALRIGVYLNDKYELDGRDPNGYTGLAWSIGGVHDRAWGERSIFGKVRYMSLRGCRSKFNVDAYIRSYSE